VVYYEIVNKREDPDRERGISSRVIRGVALIGICRTLRNKNEKGEPVTLLPCKIHSFPPKAATNFHYLEYFITNWVNKRVM
jgi:hypothetical protein